MVVSNLQPHSLRFAYIPIGNRTFPQSCRKIQYRSYIMNATGLGETIRGQLCFVNLYNVIWRRCHNPIILPTSVSERIRCVLKTGPCLLEALGVPYSILSPYGNGASET